MASFKAWNKGGNQHVATCRGLLRMVVDRHEEVMDPDLLTSCEQAISADERLIAEYLDGVAWGAQYQLLHALVTEHGIQIPEAVLKAEGFEIDE